MLVLSRHMHERIFIGHDIMVMVVEVRWDRVRLGIEAPAELAIHREEVYQAIQRQELARKIRANRDK